MLDIFGVTSWKQRKCKGRFGEDVPEIGQMLRKELPFRFIKKFYGRLE